MLNMFKKMLGLSALLIAFSSGANAQTCNTPPDCAAMGFKYTAAQCGNAEKIKCPFGEAYFCSYCEINGYTATSNCLDGQTTVTCPINPTKFKCSGVACDSGYSTTTSSCTLMKCQLTQSTNTRCKQCISSGGGMTRAQASIQCDCGIISYGTNNCGELIFSCCNGGLKCLMIHGDACS